MKVLALCLLLAVAVYGSDRPAIRMPLSQTPGHQAHIVNGTDANISEFPFMCSLRFVSTDFLTCGCTILSSSYVLTANRCVVSGALYIVVGTSSLSFGGTRYDVIRVIQHEFYDPNKNYLNDISLLKTTEPIVFNSNVAPAKLPTSDVAGGDLVTITGWGRVSFVGEISDILQKIENLPIVGLPKCRRVTGLDLYEGQLCAGGLIGQGSCNADSGGALSRDGTIYGIPSFNLVPCASGLPDMYTRVYFYIDWIKHYTGIEASELKFA